jgi:hypothetical protein
MPYNLAAPFEALFRKHLADVYHILQKKVPSFLEKSILENWPQESPGRTLWEGLPPWSAAASGKHEH